MRACRVLEGLQGFSDMLPRLDEEDPNNHEYWCRERVRGRKKMKQSQLMEESVEAEGTSDAFNMSNLESSMLPSALGIPAATNAKLEEPDSEALKGKGGGGGGGGGWGVGRCLIWDK